MSSVIVDYWQERKSKKLGSSSYRYRRVVERELRPTLGKGEITIPLGNAKGEALAKYRQVHREVEQMLASAWDEVRGISRPKTARELFQETVDRIRALGLNPYRQPTDDDETGDEDETRDWIERSVVADAIAAKYPTDPETDYPMGVSAEDTRLVRMLYTSSPKTPAPTVEDAKKLYLTDRFALNEPGPLARKKDEQRAARAVAYITKALGRVPTVASIRREDARKVQGYIRGEVGSKATVDRYLNDIRAIINHAIAEFDELHGLPNHFTGLPDLAGGRNGGVLPQEEGRPLTDKERRQIRERIQAYARKDDLKLIWRMLEGTGCRLSEVTGLRAADVVTHGEMPYIEVEWHEERRVKTVPSRRRVPLVGDALDAAGEALKLARGARMLFPRYGREGGGNSASGALMRHVRKITDDPKAVTNSLRHNMKDMLRRADVDKHKQDLILGHTLSGVGERYGGPDVRLEVATKAMRQALLG
ncbi:tyrosine-type recombinase/integrase [Mesorhizobium sp. LNJC394B00]|uniref:tyrosine-type recombinase/integrase n=1 Tax=Mesorhizobium sp. LNJC394B00 TaxID=1287274 RepID=UPI0012EB1AD1|nr:tyrosine-type recombinase/integrase [Mesorhizobium sp. LNJC394B00]